MKSFLFTSYLIFTSIILKAQISDCGFIVDNSECCPKFSILGASDSDFLYLNNFTLDLGDGTILTKNDFHGNSTTHCYSSVGTYTLQYTVYNDDGSIQCNRTGSIEIKSINHESHLCWEDYHLKNASSITIKKSDGSIEDIDFESAQSSPDGTAPFCTNSNFPVYPLSVPISTNTGACKIIQGMINALKSVGLNTDNTFSLYNNDITICLKADIDQTIGFFFNSTEFTVLSINGQNHEGDFIRLPFHSQCNFHTSCFE